MLCTLICKLHFDHASKVLYIFLSSSHCCQQPYHTLVFKFATSIKSSKLMLLHVHASQSIYICFSSITNLHLYSHYSSKGHRLANISHDFFLFTSIMLMITFVHYKPCFILFCSPHPFTMEPSQCIHWEESICGCSTEGCSTKAFWIDVSMMLKEMN
jgi:hypothetical protein